MCVTQRKSAPKTAHPSSKVDLVPFYHLFAVHTSYGNADTLRMRPSTVSVVPSHRPVKVCFLPHVFSPFFTLEGGTFFVHCRPQCPCSFTLQRRDPRTRCVTCRPHTSDHTCIYIRPHSGGMVVWRYGGTWFCPSSLALSLVGSTAVLSAEFWPRESLRALLHARSFVRARLRLPG